jgi:hypothetical protein
MATKSENPEKLADYARHVGLAAKLMRTLAKNGASAEEVNSLAEDDSFIAATLARWRNEWSAIRYSLLRRGARFYTGSEKFVAADHFVINTGPNAVVSIGYMTPTFRSWFLEKVEVERELARANFYTLLKFSLDGPIINVLGGLAYVEASLSIIHKIMRFQPRGEKGALLANDSWNIFYVRDISGTLRVVFVKYDSHNCHWHIGARPVTDSAGWHAGAQVFAFESAYELSETTQP